MKFALLISTYNWPEALDLVLKSAMEQSERPDEILIADDGSGLETKRLIEEYQEKSAVPIRHFWQEDKGFRKAIILNKAVADSIADYVIQADGDCILNKHFVRDHKSMAAKGQFLFGSRVNIQASYLPTLFEKKRTHFSFLSEGIKKRTRTLRIPILSKFYSPSKALSNKLRGCNFSFHRNDFLAINGYNEAFEGWGKEDSELAIRLLNYGCIGRRLRYKGIVYHIWHNVKSKENLARNEELQALVASDKTVFCKNGVNKYLEKSV